jgi:transcriptional regulator with XRE-family HTH domain
LPWSKGKTLPGKPTATFESAYILRVPKQLGRASLGALLERSGVHVPPVLHALNNVAKISQADLAKAAGVTRGRIGHYLNLDERVPEDRERRFYEILRGVTEEYEQTVKKLDEDPELSPQNERLVPEAVPVAREIAKACREVLNNYEAAQHLKDDADKDEVT